MDKKIGNLIKLVILANLLWQLINGRVIASFICLFCIILLFVADYLYVKLSYSLVFQIIIYLFLISSLIGGEVYDLYYKVWYLDIISHIMSSFIVSGLAVYVIKWLKGSMNKWLILIFIFSFAMMIASLWEITEFTIDRVLNRNMQKDTMITEITSELFPDSFGKPIKKKINTIMINGNIYMNGYIDIGLIDTMEDIICAVIGSLIFILTYIKRGFLV